MVKNIFRNKLVVITDGESALGQALAIEIAKQKAEVVIIGQNKNKLNKVVEEVSQLKKTGRVIPIVGKLCSKADCDNTFNSARRSLGSIDILINNLSEFNSGKVEDNNFRKIESTVNTNILGSIFFTQNAIPILRGNKKPGIINIIDFMGRIALPYLSVYSATKYAMVGFTQALQRELVNDKIHLMAVYTAGIKDAFNEEATKKFTKIGFSFDDPNFVAKRIVEMYNLGKSELILGKKEKSLAFWNVVSKNSVDNKIKKIRTKILNAVSEID